jgi:predicted nucleotidyltransferase
METTKNQLPINAQHFFYKLSDYLDTKLFFYGSVQRNDYISGKSDIDVAIFTENEHSTMTKLQHFLHVNRKDFKKFVWTINNTTVYGYKIKYENTEKDIITELTIYNEKFKEIIITEQKRKFKLPFYISIALYILKIIYYELHFLPSKTYDACKRFLLQRGLGEPDPIFLVLK